MKKTPKPKDKKKDKKKTKKKKFEVNNLSSKEFAREATNEVVSVVQKMNIHDFTNVPLLSKSSQHYIDLINSFNKLSNFVCF